MAAFACGATARTTRGAAERPCSTGETGIGHGRVVASALGAAAAGRAGVGGGACRGAAAAAWAAGSGPAAFGGLGACGGLALAAAGGGLAWAARLAAVSRLMSSSATARTVTPDSPGYLAT